MIQGRWRVLMAVATAVTLFLVAAGSTTAAPRDRVQPTTVSGTSPFAPGCAGLFQRGGVYRNAEVEPFVAVNPRDERNIVGVWQQDRWSNGGANGLGTGVSYDGGQTWKRVFVPFSRCAGGNAANGGDYARASDPWVTFAPNGDAYQISLSINGGPTGAPNQASAILVSKSGDGGSSWSAPITLIRDGREAFNDKESITADPTDARYVYAVWDRLSSEGGPTYFARTTDGGNTWEPARAIYNPPLPDPNGFSQTIGNQIVVLPNGTLVNVAAQVEFNPTAGSVALFLVVIRSTDKGTTWSEPSKIDDVLSVGVRDPITGLPVRAGDILPDIAVDGQGTLYVVWQDARFSNGKRDGIALSRSTDGGLTWSAPVQVNRAGNVQAFTPSVHVASDGTMGVSYFDFRSDTQDPATLLTDYRLVQSRDGARTGRASRIAGPFNMLNAPFAGGYFIGDYMGLSNVGSSFLLFFVQTNNEDLANRTDVFAATSAPSSATGTSTQQADDADTAYSFAPAGSTDRGAWQHTVGANVRNALNQRLPDWVESPFPR